MPSVSSWVKPLAIEDINYLWSCPISLAFLLYFKCFVYACRLGIDMRKFFWVSYLMFFSRYTSCYSWRFHLEWSHHITLKIFFYTFYSLCSIYSRVWRVFNMLHPFSSNYIAASLLYYVFSDIFTLQHRHNKNQFNCLVVYVHLIVRQK